MTSSSSTLADRVYALAFGWETDRDPEVLEPLRLLERTFPKVPPNACAPGDWGLALGMAIAVARFDDPFEDIDIICKRALEATAEAYKRFTHFDMLAVE